jgi:hypothetical protein
MFFTPQILAVQEMCSLGCAVKMQSAPSVRQTRQVKAYTYWFGFASKF